MGSFKRDVFDGSNSAEISEAFPWIDYITDSDDMGDLEIEFYPFCEDIPEIKKIK